MGEDEKKPVTHTKSYSDIQKIKLEKLMANPTKPVHIPERPVDRNVNKAAEFCHNIMGSSAGAGSGEFHLYRQMRRKEQNRQKILAYRKYRDELNEAYKQKLEENQKNADERTEKKRKKRQKKKQKEKNKKPKIESKEDSEEQSESDAEIDEKKKDAEEKKVPAEDPLMKEPSKKPPLIIQF